MPEEAAPAVEQETPVTPEQAAPEGTPAETPEIDYEKRYNDLRSDYDRRNQRVSELEQFYGQLADPQTQAEALQALGLELADVEDDEELEADPDARIERMEQFLSQRAEAEAEQELFELERQYLDQEIGKLDDTLSEKEQEAVRNLALSLQDSEGLPDVNAAHELLKQVAEERQQRYLESKKAPRVELGQAGLEKEDMSDPDVRVRLMAEAVEAARED